MNPLKIISALIILLVLSDPAYAWAGANCGLSTQNSSRNVSFNFTINGTLFCTTGVDWFNITTVTTDTNTTKLFNYTASNGSIGIRIIINHTDNNTNYSVRIFNGTTGNVTQNVTVKSNSTGWLVFNMTNFGTSGWENMTIINDAGSNAIPAAYIYTAAFATLVGAGAAIYLRRIKKV